MSEAGNLRVKAYENKGEEMPEKRRFRVSQMQILNFSLYASYDYISFAFLIWVELHLTVSAVIVTFYPAFRRLSFLNVNT